MDFFQRLFDTSSYPPRWHCGQWTPFEGWLHIVSDATIFVAYAAIPLGLAICLMKRRDLPFPGLVALFVAFILSCGITHLVEAAIFWEPVYRFSGLLKAITAVVSMATAFVLLKNLPALLALPSVHQAQQSTKEALAKAEAAAEELSRTRDILEQRSSQLTLRTRRMSKALEACLGVAVHWRAGETKIEWEVGFAASARSAGLRLGTDFNDWSLLLAPKDLARLMALCNEDHESFDFEAVVANNPTIRLRMAVKPEPVVAGESVHWAGLFRFIPENQVASKPTH